MEHDSKGGELNKLHEQLRSFKDDTSSKYESYNKALAQQESMSESKHGQLKREIERLKDYQEDLTSEQQKSQIKLHEQEVKLDAYLRENERLIDENKRNKDLIN
jgi:uncharacterized coiled-coil protein SlyX